MRCVLETMGVPWSKVETLLGLFLFWFLSLCTILGLLQPPGFRADLALLTVLGLCHSDAPHSP